MLIYQIPNDLILDEIPMLHRHEDMLEQEELAHGEGTTNSNRWALRHAGAP